MTDDYANRNKGDDVDCAFILLMLMIGAILGGLIMDIFS